MARVINANALAKLATQFGTEPINIIEIQWVTDGPRDSYSDRDISGGIKGKILEVGGLDAIVQVSGGGDSQSISVKLDDTDGSLKSIIDSQDIHKRPAWVYQYFEGLATTDKFLIFKGQISSPIEWNEGDRTVSFDIISKIEDVEVGFSIEEGDFVNIADDLMGKPWPLCFGTVINVPALKVKSVRQGILATGNGIRDFTLAKRIETAEELFCPLNFVGWSMRDFGGGPPYEFSPVYEEDADCLKRKCEILEQLNLEYTEQGNFQFPTMTIFGGDKFPQGVELTLDINGGKFIGSFSGEIFTVTGRRHPKQADDGNVVQDDTQNVIQSECGNKWIDTTESVRQRFVEQFPQFDFQTDPLHQFFPTPVLRAEGSKVVWDFFNALESAGFFWANPGDTVTLDSDQEVIYIANILPSTVLRVAAWRELNGGRQLLTVPASLYTVRQTDFTGYNVCEIVFDAPLSSRNEGWEDDIHVTLTSSVGPNTVDIIRWFIETYTDFSIDSTSFDAVELLVENYPMHFPLLERKNIITVLQEIAYQARCALWLRDDTFYIKYLATEPTVDDTVTESDVIANSMTVFHTPTEDLVTKYVAEWRKDYAIDDPNKVILRHNVSKYGTHEQAFDYYCFNIHELVVKTATFWLIRAANTWRRVKFSTPIHKLKLEVFDSVDMTLPDVGDGTIKTIVEKANYNSDTHAIDFELWTPIKSGTRVAYDFAFPADVNQQDLWPTLDERDRGFAGSNLQPNFSVIAPNNHPLSKERTGLISGFSFGGCTTIATATTESVPCRSDFGDQNPSDAGDVKPEPDASEDQAGEISTGTAPVTSAAPSDCCQAAMDLARDAMREALDAKKDAARSNEDESRTDDTLDRLPAKCGGDCSAIVKVQSIIPTLVTKAPGSDPPLLTTVEGEQGRINAGTLTKEECHTFNSLVAAQEFAANVEAAAQAKDDNYAWVVGQEDQFAVSFISSDLGLIPPDNLLPCPEPDAADRAMTGYTKTDL